MKVNNSAAQAQVNAQNKSEKATESLPFNIPDVPQQQTPDPKLNQIKSPSQHGESITVRRSYVMVVSSYEKVAQKQLLTDEAAEQFGQTLQHRIDTLNQSALREIQELPDFKRLELEDISELGEAVAEGMADEEKSLSVFALLKNPRFAELMEPKESVQRSFADKMQDFGEENLMFGALEMIKDFGGLAGMQPSQSPKTGLNIKA
jgi:hypothetical protein